MADKLTFSSMTWDLLEQKHGLRPEDAHLFKGCPPVEPSTILTAYLARARRVRLANERARAHRLVDPVLAELETYYDGEIITIPEMYLEVKDVEGLSGNPDFVLSVGSMAKAVPIVTIVEAKKDDYDPGIPQCAAEVYAAYLLDKGALTRVYGAVTTGWDWKFLCVEGAAKRVMVDRNTYFAFELPPLLGVLRYIVDVTLADLRAHSVNG